MKNTMGDIKDNTNTTINIKITNPPLTMALVAVLAGITIVILIRIDIIIIPGSDIGESIVENGDDIIPVIEPIEENIGLRVYVDRMARNGGMDSNRGGPLDEYAFTRSHTVYDFRLHHEVWEAHLNPDSFNTWIALGNLHLTPPQ